MPAELENIQIVTKISQGAFGEIYECVDEETDGKYVVKIEKNNSSFQLNHEYFVYKKLEGMNTPRVYDYGKLLFNGMYFNAMTMDKLGLSLEKLYVKQNRKFSTKTVFMIGKRCMSRIEALHHKNFIHRDIKPDNFVTDETAQKIFLIDYGLAKEYRNPRTLVHRPYKTGKNLTGTARYASLNTHLGCEQSRRDDLESLGFMMVYFMKGRLPWQGIKAETKQEKYMRIRKCKEETSIFKLCDGLPHGIYLYLLHVRNLEYEECPDYAYLESILEDGIRSRGEEDDGKYDWL